MRGLLIAFVFLVSLARAETADQVQRVLVFAERGKFAGWPAGHGAWHWGNEILVGFSVGTFKKLDSGHDIDRDQPEHHVLARSLDGGLRWEVEYPAEKGMLIHWGGMRKGITDPKLGKDVPQEITEPIRFDHPDFCMTLRLYEINGGRSRLFYSYDRGHNWRGPYWLPTFSQPGVMARTDYLVNGSKDCHVLVTVAKSNRREGRILCARTRDGGLRWSRLSFVGDQEPEGFSIMPSTVRLSAQHLVTATRRRSGDGRRRWIDVWSSQDNGESWLPRGDVVQDLGQGNPPALIQLADGRLCVTYGVRKRPYEICAKISANAGQTWSPPYVLRSGGSGPDIGYTRSIQRPDGKIVTIYYYLPADSPYPQIEATIWSPP